MSTTEYKIKVMQASLEGKQIRSCDLGFDNYADNDSPSWDWERGHYKVKEEASFIDRLFLNAPIMQMDLNTKGDKPPTFHLDTFKYKNKNDAYTKQSVYGKQKEGFWDYTRLPTFNEAPKNVWLIPWDKKPEGLKKINYMINYGSNIIFQYGVGKEFTGVWCSVKAVMLLDAF